MIKLLKNYTIINPDMGILKYLLVLRKKKVRKQMKEKKYKVAWKREIIARDMKLDDALLFIKALCEKYYMEEVEIQLLEATIPESAE